MSAQLISAIVSNIID